MKIGLTIAFGVAALFGSALGVVRASQFLGKPADKSVQTPRISDETTAPTIDERALPSPGEIGGLSLTTSKSQAWLLAEGPARESAQRFVTLTFDDGPYAETTPAVLKLLEKHHVRATFFFIGRYLDGKSHRAEARRKAARDIEAAGHIVGSHTHDHDLLTTDTHTQVLEQIDEGITSIERATGHRPELFRPPYGQLDAFGEQAIAERHLGLVLWSVEAGDMENPDEEVMFSRLIEQLDFSAGGLVLLHDVRWPTVHVLARLLDWLDAKQWSADRPEKPGYSIVDLPMYFRETSAHPQPFTTRKALEEARAVSWRATHPKI